MRDYARLSSMDGNDTYIAEFQTLSENFSSFIVGRHIVKDGDLYLINRIDPLFFYLNLLHFPDPSSVLAGRIHTKVKSGSGSL